MKKSNVKGYVVVVNNNLVSPVFGNMVSASLWLCREFGIKKQTFKLNEEVKKGKLSAHIIQLDITLGLLELLDLDNKLKSDV
jgi:hypothetical protein|uniref:Uncharacterized protein n=1 Tax=Myoviridae sp. ctp4Q36 TaxID=2827708 RepID=A0A8S5T207_9CAUD|nr:MAG TPA: hypothetical protein [Myoviridae sp. ctp4Q36]